MYKTKVVVLENEHIELGCPVSGVPEPDIAWLVNGQLLEEGTTKRGVMLALGGKSVSFTFWIIIAIINFCLKISNSIGNVTFFFD